MKDELEKIKDSLMYDFPKHYTNSEIMAYQKGLEKLASYLTKEGYVKKAEIRLDEGKIMEVLSELAEKQMRAVVRAVDKKGLMKTEWADIDKENGKEICICAAVKTEDGLIIRGHRHGDCFRTIIAMGREIGKGVNAQGFVTSKNRFVDREEGARLQREAGIKSVWTKQLIKNTLFSEDLY